MSRNGPLRRHRVTLAWQVNGQTRFRMPKGGISIDGDDYSIDIPATLHALGTHVLEGDSAATMSYMLLAILKTNADIPLPADADQQTLLELAEHLVANDLIGVDANGGYLCFRLDQ